MPTRDRERKGNPRTLDFKGKSLSSESSSQDLKIAVGPRSLKSAHVRRCPRLGADLIVSPTCSWRDEQTWLEVAVVLGGRCSSDTDSTTTVTTTVVGQSQLRQYPASFSLPSDTNGRLSCS